MPLYEYQCQDCENHFERIEKVSSPTDGVCPSCGGVARRLLGAPALKFKGSGWYVNDYGKGNGSRPTETEKKTDTPDSPSKATNEASSNSESTSAKDSKVA